MLRLRQVKLENFRAYSSEVNIPIEDLTVILGQNDAGKSSVLDALDIFFNEPSGNPDSDDFNVTTTSDTLTITCVFDNFPSHLILDESVPTTLHDELMLNPDGLLEIKKVFTKGKSKPEVVAIADHPQHEHCRDLLTLSNSQLKTRARTIEVEMADIDQRVNTELRQAIRDACDDLQLAESEIELSKQDAKALWEKLRPEMPLYAVFRSDRPSTDQDAEAQDPMKLAIKEAIAEQTESLEAIRERVETQVREIANRTVDKIMEMSPTLARELNPRVETKKWESIFNVSLTGDEDIPINKRGSGTRRLVLLNFFRARAEQRSTENNTGVIYAVEEPETSQHPNNQEMLVEAFEDLTMDARCQVLLTTHTPVLSRHFSRDKIRILERTNGQIALYSGEDDEALERIVNTLGILPNHDIKIFVGVEGKNDITFLRTISKILASEGEDVPDLSYEEDEGRLVFIPCGGSNVELWVARLKDLNIPEFHIFDRDAPPDAEPHYTDVANQINEMSHASAVHTSKRELENYLHPDVILSQVSGYSGPSVVGEDHDCADIPKLVADAYGCNPRKAKKRLNTEIVSHMTPELLSAVDPNGDLRAWLKTIRMTIAE
mgnify:CR=1 FL=1